MTFKSFQNKPKLFSINSNTTEHQNSLQIETFHQYSSNNKKPHMLNVPSLNNMINSQTKFKPIQGNLIIEKGKASLTSIEAKSFVKMEEKMMNFRSKGGAFLHSNNQ